MTQPNPFDSDFRRSFFADDPNLAFQTSIAQSGLRRNQADFFRRRASDFLGRFEGALGKQLDAFGTTDLNPLEFFKGIDFNQEFLRFSPSQRGENPSIFNPRTRSIFR